jgi:hypothetical protein
VFCGVGYHKLCLILSNSGDTLKLMIPSLIRKYLSGQNNYLGKVISHKMSENEMGYRGSKSVLVSSTVKEQRVDGSRLKVKKVTTFRSLRYTLMGGASGYQVKNPSNQIKKQLIRCYTTKVEEHCELSYVNKNLNP